MKKNETTNPSDPKRILILTADTGLGHRITAQAILDAMKELYGDACEVTIINPMDDARTPEFLREGQVDYDKAVREMPDLYQLGYQMSDVPLAVAIIETGLTVMLSQIMRDVLNHYRPHVIVTTHQNYLAPLKAVFDTDEQHIPLFTVVTDLATVHQMWFNSVADLCMVPTETARDQAISCGFSPDKVKITGIPVSPKMAVQPAEQADLRELLDWQPDLRTVLVVGGKRVANLRDALRALNHSALPLQLVIVAGGDDELYGELQKTKWHLPAYLYNFVDNMPTLMWAADCIICKAGGLIVTEALACGLPLLLFGVIPGQETGNANFIIENEAGEMAQTPLEVLDIMSHWLQDDGRLLAQRAQNARELARPYAAYETADLIWMAAQRGPARSPKGILKGLLDFKTWLYHLDVLWKREFGLDTSRASSQFSEEEG